MTEVPLIVPGVGWPETYTATLAVAGLAVLIAVAVLTRHQGGHYSPALVYLLLGSSCALAVAVLDVEWITLEANLGLAEHLSELTVVVALFATGLRIDRRLSFTGWRSAILLIAVTMPITIAVVVAIGYWGMGLSLGAAVVLGAALAPTDPVLAGDVGVGAAGEGGEDEASFALTSEAGLNDGLAFPFVFLGLTLAVDATSRSILEWFFADLIYAVAGGIAVGWFAGHFVGKAARHLRRRGAFSAEFDGWAALGVSLTTYGVAELCSTYGFLAAFVAGLSFRRTERDETFGIEVSAAGERLERFLEMAMILFLGSVLTSAGISLAGWWSAGIAVALICVVRPAAVAVALINSPLAHKERLYVAWFGVRGVGSIYYATAAAGAGIVNAAEATRIVWIVIVVVAVSVFVHGTTATLLTRRLIK